MIGWGRFAPLRWTTKRNTSPSPTAMSLRWYVAGAPNWGTSSQPDDGQICFAFCSIFTATSASDFALGSFCISPDKLANPFAGMVEFLASSVAAEGCAQILPMRPRSEPAQTPS